MIENGKGPIYFDTETCGLHGPTVIIQWAQGDGPVSIHEVWRSEIGDTLALIEAMALNPDGVIGFNLTFDWFHLCQTYTTLLLLADKVGTDAYPDEFIDEYAVLESAGRDGPCLKPVTACDLMLVARKGPYQSTMDRSDIRIRRVPTPLAHHLAAELETRVPLKDIYFARKKDKHAKHWKVFDIEDEEGDVISDFKDVVLNFAPSSALKALVCDALGVQPDAILLFADVAVDKVFNPIEYGYAPFATAGASPSNWNGKWPAVIEHHINHWGHNPLARKYAAKDVEYLPQLYRFFGSPAMGDDDSVLACMVGAVRWRGFRVNVDGIRELRRKALVVAAKTPTAPNTARKYIEQVLDRSEMVALKGSTKKMVLEAMVNKPEWAAIPCPVCDEHGEVSFGGGDDGDRAINPDSDPDEEGGYVEYAFADREAAVAVMEAPTPRGVCEVCDGKKTYRHPASIRAQAVLDARAADKEIELYDKLIMAGRFHASFKITGTLSNRMAGADKLNPQGIKKTKEVRKCFPLAWPGQELNGGDFISFEVVIADAVYGDPDLRAQLLEKVECPDCAGSGRKKCKYDPCKDCLRDGTHECKDCKGTGQATRSIHAIFGTFVYPGMTYDDIMATKNTAIDLYTRAKSAVFAMLYGGEGYTLMTRLGVLLEVADRAYRMFTSRFKKVGEERRKVFDMFCSMRQPNGIGTRVEWHEPADYIESIFGFRRFFTLENMICRALYDLAEKPPKLWAELCGKAKVVRRDRKQFVVGATQSALLGAAFMMQAANMRAAANHVIQCAGAYVTKKLQRNIWDLQPAGVAPFVVLPLNVHDEIQVPTDPAYRDRLDAVVNATVESFRDRIPLIGIDWSSGMNSWADK